MTGRDEDELESYLQRRALLRTRSHQEGLEPPPELDQIVLRKARLAIQSSRPAQAGARARVSHPAQVAHAPHGRRWYAPASVAATVLVCLTLLADLGVHVLHTVEPPTSAPLDVAASTEAAQIPAAELAEAQSDAHATATVYSAATLYSSYSSAPIFEVVIRTARLTARPVTDAARSAGPASR